MPQDEPIRIQITGTPRRPTAKKPRRRTWLWIGSAAVSAVAAIAVLSNSGRKAERPLPPAKPTVAAPAAAPGAAPSQVDGSEENEVLNEDELIVDDPTGRLLWGAPVHGPPISLAYVPDGVQCLVYLRPAEVVAHPEGERVLAALGPWGAATAAKLQRLLGAELAEVESLLASFTVDSAGRLQATLRAEFASDWDDAELARRFPDAASTERDGTHLRTVDGRTYFLAGGPRPALIVAPPELAAELIDSTGEPPPLVRAVESLAERSDAARDATLIIAPNFLQASGGKLLAEEAAPLRDAVRRLARDDAMAVALSFDWGDDFFVELRAVPALNVSPRRLAAKLREQIVALPDAVEEVVLAAPWHPHGRKVVARFPGMLRALARYTRASDDGGTALLRTYLPAAAGHNLLMAAELFLTQPRSDVAAALPDIPSAASPASIEQRLAAVTSLRFTKESLEEAIHLLAEDMGVEIVVAGGDLQLDGITKNQSLGLDLRDRPAGEILVEILLRANPDRTATGPADPRQKLVYVVEPPTDDAPGRIIVTTRTAAEKRGDRLPEPFATPN